MVIDCSSYIANDILSAVALMEADSVLRLANCDLKSIGYLSSQLPLLRELHWDEDKQYKSCVQYQASAGCRPYRSGAGRRCFQAAPLSRNWRSSIWPGRSWNDLSMKDSKAFRQEIEKICKGGVLMLGDKRSNSIFAAHPVAAPVEARPEPAEVHDIAFEEDTGRSIFAEAKVAPKASEVFFAPQAEGMPFGEVLSQVQSYLSGAYATPDYRQRG